MVTPVHSSCSLMGYTSTSLLVRVKDRDELAWQRLAQLYGPMVYRWTRRAGIPANDAEDVIQTVFLAVASDIDRFHRSRPEDSFRAWLWTISRHKILDYFREKERVAVPPGGTTAHLRLQQFALPEPDPSEIRNDRCRLRHRVVAMLRDQFESHEWESFHRTAVHGDRPADVARDLGVAVSTVYRAKVRVLERLRIELEGL